MEQKPIVSMRGRKVYLRPLAEEHIPAYQRWINDSEVNRYLKIFLPSFIF